MVKVKEDLTGRRFGKLVVLEQADDYINPKSGRHRDMWLCRCDCGKEKIYRGCNLKSNNSTSCGCARRGVRKHGVCDIEIGNNEATYYAYQMWSNILKRCFNQKLRRKVATYEPCTVAEEWLVFSNFQKWFDENLRWYTGDSRIEIDKDILQKHNKHYSPETCVVVPHEINTLFTKSDCIRGPYPIGVCLRKPSGKYRAELSMHSKKNHIGYYDTPEQAFYAYKQAKEQYIKQVADEYKAKYPDFPQKLYDAMYAYEVEITD